MKTNPSQTNSLESKNNESRSSPNDLYLNVGEAIDNFLSQNNQTADSTLRIEEEIDILIKKYVTDLNKDELFELLTDNERNAEISELISLFIKADKKVVEAIVKKFEQDPNNRLITLLELKNTKNECFFHSALNEDLIIGNFENLNKILKLSQGNQDKILQLITCKNIEGESPIMRAFKRKNHLQIGKIFSFLKDFKRQIFESISIKEQDKETPLEFVFKSGDHNIIEVILTHFKDDFSREIVDTLKSHDSVSPYEESIFKIFFNRANFSALNTVFSFFEQDFKDELKFLLTHQDSHGNSVIKTIFSSSHIDQEIQEHAHNLVLAIYQDNKKQLWDLLFKKDEENENIMVKILLNDKENMVDYLGEYFSDFEITNKDEILKNIKIISLIREDFDSDLDNEDINSLLNKFNEDGELASQVIRKYNDDLSEEEQAKLNEIEQIASQVIRKYNDDLSEEEQTKPDEIDQEICREFERPRKVVKIENSAPIKRGGIEDEIRTP
ncbi:MAG: hypothetical protein RL769_760 [Pseudomonadota bacterium]|jgi:hypothetical protein